jgi:GT2 family glycosyltransferase
MPSLAVIIVNYNTRELLAHCLQSVYANRVSFPYHVVVVDNLSSDGSAEMVRARFPQATLITSDRNGGFGYANNLALRWIAGQAALPGEGGNIRMKGPAHGRQPASEIPADGYSPYTFPCDHILFLNPDTVLPHGALQDTVNFLEEHPEAGVVGPKAASTWHAVGRSPRPYPLSSSCPA